MVLFQNDPFRDLDTLFDRVGKPRTAFSALPMDAYRRDSDVWVHLDIPGASPDSIDISLERNVLTVSAERGWARQEGDQIYLNERRSGTFTRQVHLGDGLDGAAIEADYSDGVLTLRIPVSEKAQPRKIEVKGNQHAHAIETETADA